MQHSRLPVCYTCRESLVERMPTPDAARAHGFKKTELATPLFLLKPAFLFAVELPEKRW